jgi:hypothetical protein
VSEIQLTGLQAETPIGFLAALGAFRHTTQMPGQLGDVRLRWQRAGNRWCAALVTECEVSTETLLTLFTERICKLGERPEFAWADQIKKNTVEQFREAAKQAQTEQDWFAAFGSELVLSQAGTVQSTDFDMTGGQQKFLLKLREASTSLSASPEETVGLIREALFGPWLYASSTKVADRNNSHSLGLDPSTVLQGAFSAEEPAEIKDKRGVRGAIWLAFAMHCRSSHVFAMVGHGCEQRALSKKRESPAGESSISNGACGVSR